MLATPQTRPRGGVLHSLAIDKVPLAALFNPQKVCKVNLCCASKAHRKMRGTRMYIYIESMLCTLYKYICVCVFCTYLHAVSLNWVPSVDSEATPMMIFLCQRRHFCLIWKSAVFPLICPASEQWQFSQSLQVPCFSSLLHTHTHSNV